MGSHPKARLILIGTSHRYAPIAIREHLSCPSESLPSRLGSLLKHEDVSEAVIVSTCNRTEIYASASNECEIISFLTQRLSEWSGVSIAGLRGLLYSMQDEEAVSHLFEVAAGLDSLVIGEAQIQGQVREAARIASECRSAGRMLGELFRRAQNVASRTRKEVQLSTSNASVSSAAIALLKKETQGNRINSILLIGAGKMISLAANDLSLLNIREVLVANRTIKRAEILATKLNGRPLAFDQIGEALARVDVVLTCTSSSDYVISSEQLRRAISMRNGRPLILVDAGVPRNIDPSSSSISCVRLFNIDDLSSYVTVNREVLTSNVMTAREMIREEVRGFFAHLREYDANDTVKDLMKIAEQIREEELSRALRKMGQVTTREREIVDILTKRLVNKLLYQPTATLKEHASDGDGETYEAVVRELFAIDREPDG